MQAEVQARVDAYLANTNTDTATVNITGLCGGTGTDATVVVNYDHTFALLDGIAGLATRDGSTVLSPTITLNGTSTMRNE